MKNILKIIGSVVLIIFLIYFVYRNINLWHVPKSDLVKNEATSKLYRKVIPNTDNISWMTYYYTNKDVKVNDIPEGMKYNIAFKNTGTGMNEVDEETLKKAYEDVYGEGSYKPVESFYGGCTKYYYDKINKMYKAKERNTCKSINTTIISKITDAEEKNNKFNLTVEIAYLDGNTRTVYKDCDSSLTSCTNIIEKNAVTFAEENLDEKNYNLHKYKFYYEGKNNNYYFVESKKIK